MFAKIPQRSMHVVRWILAIGWLGLIGSLLIGNVTGIPFLEWSHKKGTSIFWGTIVPAAIAILIVFGHEGWRRICPLGFMSQISQRLGLRSPKRIEEDSWLGTYHLYVQCGLLFLGLGLRLLWCNGSPIALGILCLVTIVAAILVGYRYGGRSWCHYFCPMSPVQTAIGGPRGLFSSAAHTAPPMSLTQSKCRTWDKDQGKEISACVTCKSPCVDIDAEQTYWEELLKPGRQLLQYGYLGLVVGFFGYFLLYDGGWDYYYEGMFYRAREAGNLWSPGFFFTDIPRVVAIPLTLAVAAALTTSLGYFLERSYKGYLLRNADNLDIPEAEIRERARHRIFCIFTAIAFNAFFAFGWRTLISPESVLHHGLTLAATLPSAWWLYRNFNRDRARYTLEGESMTLRRQIKKLPIDLSEHLGQRSIEDLRPEELDLLANILPQISRGSALQLFTGLVEELADKGWHNPQENWAWLDRVQTRLGIDDDDREQALKVVGLTRPNLLRALTQNSDNDRTLRYRAQTSRRASRRKSPQAPARPRSASPAPRQTTPPSTRPSQAPQPAKGSHGEGARIAARLNRDFLVPPRPAHDRQEQPAISQPGNSAALPKPPSKLPAARKNANRAPEQRADAWTQPPTPAESKPDSEREARREEKARADALRRLSKQDKESDSKENLSGIDRVLARLGIDSSTREQVLKSVDRAQPKKSRSQTQSSDQNRTLANPARKRRASQPRPVQPAARVNTSNDRLRERDQQDLEFAKRTIRKSAAANPYLDREIPPLSPSLEELEDYGDSTFENSSDDMTLGRTGGKSKRDRASVSPRSSKSKRDGKTVMRRAGESNPETDYSVDIVTGPLNPKPTPETDANASNSQQASDVTANASDYEQTLDITRPEIEIF